MFSSSVVQLLGRNADGSADLPAEGQDVWDDAQIPQDEAELQAMVEQHEEQRLRDIDIMNEHREKDHANKARQLHRFSNSVARQRVWSWILTLNWACRNQSNPPADASPPSPGVCALVEIFDKVLDPLVDSTPPLQTMSRFGNPAFRSFLARLKASAEQIHVDLLRTQDAAPSPAHEDPQADDDSPSPSATAPFDWASPEQEGQPPALLETEVMQGLVSYLCESFGNIRRIDYGTGHELNFICWLYCLAHPSIQLVKPSDYAQLVTVVFKRYLRFCRRLQETYLLEPAGSRGAWGLDDFSFLPFLWGSSQLFSHKHLRPKSIRSPDVIEGFATQYMYLEAIKLINQVKLCSFAEHSPLLNDITCVKSWGKVNSGLCRMYATEVLGKFAVVQHFIYSIFLPDRPAPAEGDSQPSSTRAVSWYESELGIPDTRIHEPPSDHCHNHPPHAPAAAAAAAVTAPDNGNDGQQPLNQFALSHGDGIVDKCCSAGIPMPSAVSLTSSARPSGPTATSGPPPPPPAPASDSADAPDPSLSLAGAIASDPRSALHKQGSFAAMRVERERRWKQLDAAAAAAEQ